MTCPHCKGTKIVSRAAFGMSLDMIADDPSIQFERGQGLDEDMICPVCSGATDQQSYNLGYAAGLKDGTHGREKAEELLRE